ncbi:MipA/OmpV family protein [Massilia antarctica]|uniref:MipA/OmpV family protein n=1 Tax=Massilia antarctica TaxID=2765360 RepID=UPI0006BB6740|nr:MipA/OmpV family protein [Massilia sp. H27-R4]MCY0914791.1 MipA/OmpV family protein [Massilia sp. H27-R4]CUI08171.1 Outer membrane protein V [Janthinobacterium sp. CG23_2]CUU31957.1 Outer membrane protein V [Janthinobacterium sp. CG23_2]
MKILLTFVLGAACASATARTPAGNPMPDGSRDMYVGLGFVAAPAYEGARRPRRMAVPVLQGEWSNGVFISGMNAGVHLSDQPSLEFGPLLSVQARRGESGNGAALGGASLTSSTDGGTPLAPSGDTPTEPSSSGQPGFGARRGGPNRLSGMDVVGARLQAGGFVNVYLSPSLRLTNSVLYGSGRDANGLLWNIGIQYVAQQFSPHHSVSLSAGMSVVNRHYNTSFFGVSAAESLRSGNPQYAPGGGRNAASAGVRWHWALSPSWLLINDVQATRVLGAAQKSPLVERPNGFVVSTALAYRF